MNLDSRSLKNDGVVETVIERRRNNVQISEKPIRKMGSRAINTRHAFHSLSSEDSPTTASKSTQTTAEIHPQPASTRMIAAPLAILRNTCARQINRLAHAMPSILGVFAGIYCMCHMYFTYNREDEVLVLRRSWF